MSATDETDIIACAAGDIAALRRIYVRHGAALLGAARRIVRRPEIAADVLHDAFIDVWRGAATFDRNRGEGKAWLIRIVRYRALKHVRAAARETPLDEAAQASLPDDAPDALARLEASQEGARLAACLTGLRPELRGVVLLAYVDGLSHAEIAQRLSTPLGTVKAWIRRSLTSLKECLR